MRSSNPYRSIYSRYSFISCLTDGVSALERTYLGYMRTSTVFATIGVTVAQIFRLKNEGAINPPFGFFALGIPLACVFIGFALVVTVVGSWRFWRQQNALARGKIHAGGWEIDTIATITTLVGAPSQVSFECQAGC